MDRRTKILVSLFGLVLGYVIVDNVVYPEWIQPLVTLDERVAEREEELAELNAKEDRVRRAMEDYRDYLNRTGSMDIRKVENALRDELNTLIETYKLTDATVTPSRPTVDRKTDITKLVLTVSADGALESVVRFLKTVSELPQLIRVLNPQIYPVSKARRENPLSDMVSLRVGLQVMALPQQKIVGKRFEDADLVQPDAYVRHRDRDYSVIWERTPLNPHLDLDPLVVRAVKQNVTVEVGARNVTLEASASGGLAPYTFNWSPSTGLQGADTPRPRLDTREVGASEYTVTVTDLRGEVSEPARVLVEIKEKEKPPEVVQRDDPPPAPPQDPRPQRWRDGNYMQLVMMLITSSDGEREAEVMIDNARSRATEYYKTGDDFDGGKLVFVHQRGLLVHRSDGYFVYPIGSKVTEDMPVDQATEFPRLQEVAAWRAAQGLDEEEEGSADTGTDEAAAGQDDRDDSRRRPRPTRRSRTRGRR